MEEATLAGWQSSCKHPGTRLARRRRGEPLGVRPLGGTEHAQWGRPAHASPGHGSGEAGAASSPPLSRAQRFRRLCGPQREVTALERSPGARSPRLPPHRLSRPAGVGWGGTSVFLAAARRSALVLPGVVGAPSPPWPPAPHTSTGDLRAGLFGHRHGKTSE